jgi:hypothetical protein
MRRILKDLGSDSGMDAVGSLAIAKDLCQRYPYSAGKVTDMHDGIKAQVVYEHLSGSRPGTLELANTASKELATKLGKFTMGDLRYCNNHHPFSGHDFMECPECGPRVSSSFHGIPVRKKQSQSKLGASGSSFSRKAS